MNNTQLTALITKLRPQLTRLKYPALILIAVLCVYHLALALWFGFAAASFKADQITPMQAGTGERWAWFSAQHVKPVKKVPQQEVKESRLKAKLLGIVQHSNDSVAIIDTGNKKDSKVFKEGDQLNRSVSVHKIEANRVLIIEGGVISSLTMATKLSADISSKASTEAPTALNKLLPTSLKSPLLAGISFSKTPSGETGMNLGSINPKMLDGTGLEASDIVLAAGGTPVEQILNSPNSYQNLLQRDNIDITVIRNGNQESVSINPRSVAPNILRLIATQNR